MTKTKLSKEQLENVYAEYNDENLFIATNALDFIQEFEELFHMRCESKDGEQVVALAINANDLFWWACADFEYFSYNDIEDIYNHCFDKNGNYNLFGSSIWVCLKRGMRPQHPVEEDMKAMGFWCDELEALPIREETG